MGARPTPECGGVDRARLCARLQLVVDDFGGVGDVVEHADFFLIEACHGGLVTGLECGAALLAQCVQPAQRLVELAAGVGFALDVFDGRAQVGEQFAAGPAEGNAVTGG